MNWGLLTDDRGCPVAVSVFEGNTGDPKTLLPQVAKLRTTFGIDQLVMVGDRGMISSVQIDAKRGLAACSGSRRSRAGRSANWPMAERCSSICSTRGT